MIIPSVQKVISILKRYYFSLVYRWRVV